MRASAQAKKPTSQSKGVAADHLAAGDRASIVWRVPPPPQAQKTPRPGLRELARRLVRRALNEHSSPREIGMAVGAGVFAGCTPIGFHAVVALGLATALRLNRLWALVASRASIFPVYLAIAYCEIQAGHVLRSGDWAHLGPTEAFARRYELAVDWAIGTLLVGTVLATLAGLAGYACARFWRKSPPNDAVALADPVNSNRREGPRPPSLGSPTSAPPDATS